MKVKKENKIFKIKKLLSQIKYSFEHLVLFGLFSYLVLPELKIANYGLRIGTLISPIILLALINKNNFSNLKLNSLNLSFLIFTGVVITSNLHGYLYLEVPMNLKRDFIEIVKFIQFIPYLMTIKYLNKIKFNSLAHSYINLAGYIFIITGLLQIFKIPIISGAVTNLYSDIINSHGKIALKSSGRIISTAADPNIASVIAIFFLIYTYAKFSVIKSKSYKFTINFIKFFLFIILFLYTQSRTGFIAIILGILSYLFLKSRQKIKRKMLKALGVTVFFILTTFIFKLNYILLGFQNGLAGTNNSFLVRYENLIFALSKFKSSPILGWGVAKSIHTTVLDTEYGTILLRYGLLGILFVLSFYKILFHQAVILFKNKSYNLITNTLFIMIFVAFTTMFTNNIIFGYQLLSIYVFLYMLTKTYPKATPYS